MKSLLPLSLLLLCSFSGHAATTVLECARLVDVEKGKVLQDRQVLIEQLGTIARSGYAVDNGEYLTDVRTVAVPIKDYTRTVVGSLAVSGPAYRISPERVEQEIIPLAVKSGHELSSRLGYNA